jgi:hypothetical protein
MGAVDEAKQGGYTQGAHLEAQVVEVRPQLRRCKRKLLVQRVSSVELKRGRRAFRAWKVGEGKWEG